MEYKEKILCVDDDINLLNAYKRNLRNSFTIDTATSGNEGIDRIFDHGPYAVVISDLRMPQMDGIEFLSTVKDIAPDSVRIMLTGNADLDCAIDAVNEGNIFRFLTKPCPPDMLKKTIEAGMRQHKLIISEKQLLQETLRGSIKIFTEMLSIVNPEAYSRAHRIALLAVKIAKLLKIKNIWKIEIAALLSQIGCIAVPEKIVWKAFSGVQLTSHENNIFKTYPKVGFDLINKLPRLEEIAQIILYQNKNIDGTGFPEDHIGHEKIPIGSRILKVVNDYDILILSGKKEDMAFNIIKDTKNIYDKNIIFALQKTIIESKNISVLSLTINELTNNMIIYEDIYTKDGKMLLKKGQQVSSSMKLRLKNYALNVDIIEPIKVILIES